MWFSRADVGLGSTLSTGNTTARCVARAGIGPRVHETRVLRPSIVYEHIVLIVRTQTHSPRPTYNVHSHSYKVGSKAALNIDPRARDAAAPPHAAAAWLQRARGLRTHAGGGPGRRQAHGKGWGVCAHSPAVGLGRSDRTLTTGSTTARCVARAGIGPRVHETRVPRPYIV